MTIAGAVSHFYYARGNIDWMPSSPVWISFKVTAVYHMGTVAIGSFLVALLIFVRAVLEFVQRRVKYFAGAKYTSWLRYIMACVSCFLWILEKIVKFINRCNHHQTAYTTCCSLCKSTCSALVTIVQISLILPKCTIAAVP
jgi:choline transporter-like protein 2/4/5